MTVYVVRGNKVEKGTFGALRGNAVLYRTPGGNYIEHIRNVFFSRKNANHHLLHSLGRYTKKV